MSTRDSENSNFGPRDLCHDPVNALRSPASAKGAAPNGLIPMQPNCTIANFLASLMAFPVLIREYGVSLCRVRIAEVLSGSVVVDLIEAVVIYREGVDTPNCQYRESNKHSGHALHS